MSGYSKEYEIFYFQIDRFGEASLVTILGFLEDCATAHSEAIGLGIEYLTSQGTCWILNRWHLKMERFPHLGEKIVVETYPLAFQRFYGKRDFLIKDTQGTLIGKASSLWIYLNIDKRRPTRIPAHFASQYGVSDLQDTDDSFEDFAELMESSSEISFHVRRSDIDTNGHVNNTRYAEWMLEGIPEDIMSDYRLQQFEIMYKKETKYGTDIISRCQKADNTEPEYLHRISDKGDGVELASGKTVWTHR